MLFEEIEQYYKLYVYIYFIYYVNKLLSLLVKFYSLINRLGIDKFLSL